MARPNNVYTMHSPRYTPQHTIWFFWQLMCIAGQEIAQLPRASLVHFNLRLQRHYRIVLYIVYRIELIYLPKSGCPLVQEMISWLRTVSWKESFGMLAFHFESHQRFLPLISVSFCRECCKHEQIVSLDMDYKCISIKLS